MHTKQHGFSAVKHSGNYRWHHEPEQSSFERGNRHKHDGHHGHGGHHRHGRHGMHSSRKLSASDLQLILLALLAIKPSHGYELIKSLDDHSHGLYVPSPGMIYPALTYLEEIGYASVEMDGTKKRYSLTEDGRNHYEQNREGAARILSEMEKIGAQMADTQQARESGVGTAPADVVFAAILHRRSMGLSRLKPDPVDRKLIERMLEAANWAPSHGDTEPWRFTVFAGEGRETLAELFAVAQGEDTAGNAAANAPDGARKRAFAAPVWISIGMSPARKEDGSLLMSEEEEVMAVACAVQNLHLMASALGLAGMWHSKGVSTHPTVARSLGLEAPARLLGFFMCGWPATDWLTGKRRPLSEKAQWVESR